ncbi:uncharacterized protein N7479_002793, partial [Penicillium vulpinum]|uniref:uncharacterized protein n=1 Tax=Penicillium vulpinum TaxID=29845 RepID=UPI002547760C
TLRAAEAYKKSNKPNLAKLAREFAVPIDRLRGRVHGRKSNSTIASQSKALNSIQEKVLISWIYTLRNLYTTNTPEPNYYFGLIAFESL